MRWYIDMIQKRRNITTITKYRWNEAKKMNQSIVLKVPHVTYYVRAPEF